MGSSSNFNSILCCAYNHYYSITLISVISTDIAKGDSRDSKRERLEEGGGLSGQSNWEGKGRGL